MKYLNNISEIWKFILVKKNYTNLNKNYHLIFKKIKTYLNICKKNITHVIIQNNYKVIYIDYYYIIFNFFLKDYIIINWLHTKFGIKHIYEMQQTNKTNKLVFDIQVYNSVSIPESFCHQFQNDRISSIWMNQNKKYDSQTIWLIFISKIHLIQL